MSLNHVRFDCNFTFRCVNVLHELGTIPNIERGYLIVVPEDDAFRQIANGFLLFPSLNLRSIQVMGPVGGWRKVVDTFKEEYVPSMQRLQERRVVLILDCDNDVER